MSDKYVLSIGDLKLRLNGNITLLVNDSVKINSKKEDIELENVVEINKSSDIELENGFIFIKNPCIINSNQKLNIRNSIISK